MIAVLPSSASASAAPVIRADQTAVYVAGDFKSSGGVQAPPPTVEANGQSVSSGYMVAAFEAKQWSNTRESRYAELATRRALGQATEADQAEFTQLQLQRRRAKNPMSAEEMVFQYKRRQLEKTLIAKLKEYVDFIDAPRRSKT